MSAARRTGPGARSGAQADAQVHAPPGTHAHARPGRPAKAGGRHREEGVGISTETGLKAVVTALCIVGVVMVGSASPVISKSLYGTTWSLLLREVIWMVVGVGALLFVRRVDYRSLRRLRVPFLLGTLALLVAVLVPHVGVRSGGSSRWIGTGEVRIQPSELMKLAMAIFAADLLDRRSQRIGESRAVVGPILTVLAVAGILIIKQPDMGTALVLAAITFGLLFAGGVPLLPIGKVLGSFAVLGLVIGLADPYRRARLLSFLHPAANSAGSGYQVLQSLIGLGTGHLYGLGLGGGREKWGLLPNAHTDFIFSVIGEELGLFGAVAVLGLFVLLALLGLRVAGRAPDRFGSLLAVGITVGIASQAFINIGAVIGILPVTGIPLPFVSFGGTSLVITMVAIGVLLNIAGQEAPRPEVAGRSRAGAGRAAQGPRAGRTVPAGRGR